MSRDIVANYSKEVINTNVSQKLVESAGRALNPPEFVRVKRKLQRTLHADSVSKGFANFIAKEDRPANARDINLLETIWIIVDVTKYKDPAPQHWTNKGSDYASPGKMTHFGSSHILYLITQKMSEKDVLVTNISVVQC